jgi:hypothetical protein
MEYPELIHFFSWATRVSIELPVGFEEYLEDAETNSAIYADDLDDEDGELPGCRVMTKMTAVAVDSAGAYRELAAASARIGERSIESREECTVDGAPGLRQILVYRDEEAELDVIRHETFVQVENVIFSITGIAPAARREEYLPALDHASRTARFILLPAAEAAS